MVLHNYRKPLTTPKPEIMCNKVIFLFTGLIMAAGFTVAQQKSYPVAQDTSFVVNAGTRLNDAIPAKHLFHYPEFLSGKVIFRDGKVSEAKMNYSRLTDEMLFIGKGGDTLALDNEPTIKLVCIGSDTFYFDRGYVLLVKTTGAVKLGIKEGFRYGDKKKETGYDMMSAASSVTSLGPLYDDKRMYQLAVKEQTVVRTVAHYYVGDTYNRFVLATEKKLAGLLPECAGLLNEFCKKNKIDFGRMKDLDTVLSFLASACP